MTVYVDELRPVRRGKWRHACHLYGDTDEEMDAMALKIGLRPDWRQRDHYDLTKRFREAAVAEGAVEVRARDLVGMRKAKRKVKS